LEKREKSSAVKNDVKGFFARSRRADIRQVSRGFGAETRRLRYNQNGRPT
jgi:hypothetical protein